MQLCLVVRIIELKQVLRFCLNLSVSCLVGLSDAGGTGQQIRVTFIHAIALGLPCE
jgi:hypothetical protein